MKRILFVILFFSCSVVFAGSRVQLTLVTASSYGEPIEQPYLIQWTCAFPSYSLSYHTFLKEYTAAKALYDKLDTQLREGGIYTRGGTPNWVNLNSKFLILLENQN